MTMVISSKVTPKLERVWGRLDASSATCASSSYTVFALWSRACLPALELFTFHYSGGISLLKTPHGPVFIYTLSDQNIRVEGQ